MLSKRKKRIAALLTAVVLSVTAAFSLPDNIRAEDSNQFGCRCRSNYGRRAAGGRNCSTGYWRHRRDGLCPQPVLGWMGER